MHNDNSKTPQPLILEETRREMRQMAVDCSHIKEELRQTKATAESTRHEAVLQQKELSAQKRGHRFLWASLAGLAVVVLGFVWYSYPVLGEHTRLLEEIPGLKESIAAVGSRLDTAEYQLKNWLASNESLDSRMATLEKKVGSNLLAARSFARDLAGKTQKQVAAELEKTKTAFDEQVAKLAAIQEDDRARVSVLEQEIAALREQLGQQTQQTKDDATRVDQMQQELAVLELRLAEERVRHEQQVQELAGRLNRQRAYFEVSEDKTEEIVPGVSLSITGTNVSYQRVKGWMRLLPEGRTLWVRDLGIQQALTFYPKGDSRTHELVFTRVYPNGASGYVQITGEKGSPSAANNNNDE